MPAYIVSLSSVASGLTLREGNNRFIVFAADVAGARDIVRARFTNDSIDAVLLDSTTTVTAIAAATDWATPKLWNFRIRLTSPAGVDVADVTVQSSASNNTVDEIGALLVIALNADAQIAGAAYNSTTQVLTISDIADALGNHQVHASAWPDEGDEINDVSHGFFGTIVDGGIAGAVTSVALAADAAVPAIYYAGLKV